MSGKTIVRIAGLIVAAGVALGVGFDIDSANAGKHGATHWQIVVGIAVVAGVLAFLIVPYLVLPPYRLVRDQIRRAAVSDVIAAVIGLVVGLIIAAFASIFLSQITFYNLGHWLPTLAALLFAYVGIATAVLRKDDFARLYISIVSATRTARRTPREERESDDHDDHDDHEESHNNRLRDRFVGGKNKNNARTADRILVDTSTIIDGRIADIAETGFIFGTLVVPRFVLEELQHIADSADSMRRARGRRGLEVLQHLQKTNTVTVEISDADAENTPEVDAKLVKLARQWHCPIITNDFNLNQVAELQGVKVLNINELAHAVKPILLPGEDMSIKIMQDGKELGQGVGYLDDGTMIVVEGGKQYIGNTVDVTVTRVLQTVAGRMIFAHPKMPASSPTPVRRTGTA